MKPTIITSTDIRLHAREIMERVKYKRECFLVQTFSQPMAVIISVGDFEKLTQTNLLEAGDSLEDSSEQSDQVSNSPSKFQASRVM